MIRHRSSRRPPRKRPSTPRDTKKIQIAFYLDKKREKGATPNELAKKGIATSQSADIFKEYLDELLEMKWVSKEDLEIGGGMSRFTITEDGIKVVEEVKKIVDEHHPLSKLDAFDGVE